MWYGEDRYNSFRDCCPHPPPRIVSCLKYPGSDRVELDIRQSISKCEVLEKRSLNDRLKPYHLNNFLKRVWKKI